MREGGLDNLSFWLQALPQRLLPAVNQFSEPEQ